MADPSIYVPADERGDPFRQHRGQRLRRMGMIAGGGLVVVALVVGLVLLISHRSALPAEPGPLVDGLEATDWGPSSDPVTGYRRLVSPLGGGTAFDAVALGADGTLAAVIRPPTGDVSLLVWKGRHYSMHPLALGGAGVSALSVDPDGNVYLGTTEGRIGALVAGGAGVSIQPDPVSEGNGVSGIALDPGTARAAVVVASGAVLVGRRPLVPAGLRELPMPERARIRGAAYDQDGTLFVAGDAGAVFELGSDEWTDRALPTGGDVVAMGTDAYGDLLVAQSNGHVFSDGGATWDRVGQVGSRAIALGATPDLGVVVACADGRVFATLGRDDFSEVPGFPSPPPDTTVHSAQVMGHDVALARREGLTVFDGQVWESTEAGRVEGTIPEGGCELAGPDSGETSVPTWASCGGRRMRLLGSDLHSYAEVTMDGAGTSAQRLERALTTSRTDRWMGESLVRAAPLSEAPGVERWTARTQEWTRFVDTPADEGPLLSVAAVASGEGFELWTVSRQTRTVRHALVTGDEPPELVPVVSSEELAAALGGDLYAERADVFALGSRKAVLLLSSWTRSVLVRVDAEDRSAEPVDVPGTGEDGPIGVRQIGDLVLIAAGPHLFEVPLSGPVIPYDLPEGIDVGRLMDAYAVAVADGRLYLIGSHGGGPFGWASALLMCRGRRCERVPLPEGVSPDAVFLTADGRVGLHEPGGVLGVIEPR